MFLLFYCFLDVFGEFRLIIWLQNYAKCRIVNSAKLCKVKNLQYIWECDDIKVWSCERVKVCISSSNQRKSAFVQLAHPPAFGACYISRWGDHVSMYLLLCSFLPNPLLWWPATCLNQLHHICLDADSRKKSQRFSCNLITTSSLWVSYLGWKIVRWPIPFGNIIIQSARKSNLTILVGAVPDWTGTQCFGYKGNLTVFARVPLILG